MQQSYTAVIRAESDTETTLSLEGQIWKQKVNDFICMTRMTRFGCAQEVINFLHTAGAVSEY